MVLKKSVKIVLKHLIEKGMHQLQDILIKLLEDTIYLLMTIINYLKNKIINVLFVILKKN